MGEDSLFDEPVEGGYSVPQRPDFSDDIRKFGAKPRTTEKREKLKCWLYVEYYETPERFAEITSMIKSHISGLHQLDREFFYKMVKETVDKE